MDKRPKKRTRETSKEERERAREEFQNRLKPILKFFLSIKKLIEFNINIKFYPSPTKTLQDGSIVKSGHDYAILFRETKGQFDNMEELQDLQPLISMFTEKLRQFFKLEFTQVLYDKQQYICIYIDVPEDTKQKLKEATK